MDKEHKPKTKFGLIGKNIDYSFSKAYFSKKFEDENLPCSYQNFDIQNIEELKIILSNNPNIKGLNVTIPYKEQIIPYLDKLSKKAKYIGAVNTVNISKKGKLIGYNTDYYGFKKSLKPHLKPLHKKALILGTVGASKAVTFGLKQLKISFEFVSRLKNKNTLYTYLSITKSVLNEYQIIINCTPLGTFPNVDNAPQIPYNALNSKHILYDLIYNPPESKFLKLGKQFGATTINGQQMLVLQAERSWQIWN